MERQEEHTTYLNPPNKRPTVLHTKLHKTPLRSEFVKRQTLIDRLESHINLPLTLISAATGCGKSVTASQWLEQSNHDYGWLSLDDEHNNINVFLTYLVALLHEKFPEKTFGVESLLQGVNLPSNLLASTLINDIDQLERFFVLVLDDYQVINNEKIHEIINTVLQFPPEHFHLVILTQRDPPLKLVKMRARFGLSEVRMKDLAFTNEEAFELSVKVGAATTPEQIDTLVKHTDGWITAISAGLLVLADGVKFEKVIQSTHNRDLVISELLEEVVLKGMSIATQKFLELSALPDRFSAELINVMVAAIDDGDLNYAESEEFIRLSKRRNLFLIPLDTSQQWYRYHHFFRNQIKKRIGTHLTQEMVSTSYKAASFWFEKENFIEEALKYAILSEDMTYAVNLFDRIRNDLFNTEQFQRLDRLIDLFPQDARNSYLELTISCAMLQDHKGDFLEMEKCLSQASQLFEDKSKEARKDYIKKLKGEFHSVSTFLPYITGNFDQCISEAQKSLNLLPTNQPNYFREFAIAYLVFANQAKGKIKECFSVLEENLESLSVSDQYFRGRLVFNEMMVHGMQGDTKKMHNAALQLNSLVEPKSFPGAWMAGIYYLSISDYLSNKPETVDRFYQELWQYRYVGRPYWVVHNIIVMGLASLAMGRWDKVNYYFNECLEFSSELEIEPIKGMVYAFGVELALRRNDLEQAIELSALANFDPLPPIFYYYYPQLTRVKLYLQTDKKEKGIEQLKELLDVGQKRNNVNLVIQALALQTTIYANESDYKKAKIALNEALTLSKNKQLVRPFLDCGEPIYQVLKALNQEKQEDNQIKELLQAFRNGKSTVKKQAQVSTGGKLHQINALSNRELEILELVSKGYRNIEIAEKLFISLDTVKKHLYHAYKKLYVKNRINAIKKAQELGLVGQE